MNGTAVISVGLTGVLRFRPRRKSKSSRTHSWLSPDFSFIGNKFIEQKINYWSDRSKSSSARISAMSKEKINQMSFVSPGTIVGQRGEPLDQADVYSHSPA